MGVKERGTLFCLLVWQYDEAVLGPHTTKDVVLHLDSSFCIFIKPACTAEKRWLLGVFVRTFTVINTTTF